MLISQKTSIYFSVELSPREISYDMCTRSTARSFALSNDAKIVRSWDAQCKTEESL